MERLGDEEAFGCRLLSGEAVGALQEIVLSPIKSELSNICSEEIFFINKTGLLLLTVIALRAVDLLQVGGPNCILRLTLF